VGQNEKNPCFGREAHVGVGVFSVEESFGLFSSSRFENLSDVGENVHSRQGYVPDPLFVQNLQEDHIKQGGVGSQTGLNSSSVWDFPGNGGRSVPGFGIVNLGKMVIMEGSFWDEF
jgi:hypothetical protein